MLLARCVDSRSDFLETTRDEMAENVLKGFTCSDFQKTFRSRDVFWTLRRPFVRMDSRLQRDWEIVTFCIFEGT